MELQGFHWKSNESKQSLLPSLILDCVDQHRPNRTVPRSKQLNKVPHWGQQNHCLAHTSLGSGYPEVCNRCLNTCFPQATLFPFCHWNFVFSKYQLWNFSLFKCQSDKKVWFSLKSPFVTCKASLKYNIFVYQRYCSFLYNPHVSKYLSNLRRILSL